jgi:hypothetical protein
VFVPHVISNQMLIGEVIRLDAALRFRAELMYLP